MDVCCASFLLVCLVFFIIKVDEGLLLHADK